MKKELANLLNVIGINASSIPNPGSIDDWNTYRNQIAQHLIDNGVQLHTTNQKPILTNKPYRIIRGNKNNLYEIIELIDTDEF